MGRGFESRDEREELLEIFGAFLPIGAETELRSDRIRGNERVEMGISVVCANGDATITFKTTTATRSFGLHNRRELRNNSPPLASPFEKKNAN